MSQPKPRWAYELYAFGSGDLFCADDDSLPINPLIRQFWKVRGLILCKLFGWWWGVPSWDHKPMEADWDE